MGFQTGRGGWRQAREKSRDGEAGHQSSGSDRCLSRGDKAVPLGRVAKPSRDPTKRVKFGVLPHRVCAHALHLLTETPTFSAHTTHV